MSATLSKYENHFTFHLHSLLCQNILSPSVFTDIYRFFFILSINATLAVSKNKEQEGKMGRHVAILPLLKE